METGAPKNRLPIILLAVEVVDVVSGIFNVVYVGRLVGREGCQNWWPSIIRKTLIVDLGNLRARRLLVEAVDDRVAELLAVVSETPSWLVCAPYVCRGGSFGRPWYGPAAPQDEAQAAVAQAVPTRQRGSCRWSRRGR